MPAQIAQIAQTVSMKSLLKNQLSINKYLKSQKYSLGQHIFNLNVTL